MLQSQNVEVNVGFRNRVCALVLYLFNRCGHRLTAANLKGRVCHKGLHLLYRNMHSSMHELMHKQHPSKGVKSRACAGTRLGPQIPHHTAEHLPEGRTHGLGPTYDPNSWCKRC